MKNGTGKFISLFPETSPAGSSLSYLYRCVLVCKYLPTVQMASLHPAVSFFTPSPLAFVGQPQQKPATCRDSVPAILRGPLSRQLPLAGDDALTRLRVAATFSAGRGDARTQTRDETGVFAVGVVAWMWRSGLFGPRLDCSTCWFLKSVCFICCSSPTRSDLEAEHVTCRCSGGDSMSFSF